MSDQHEIPLGDTVNLTPEQRDQLKTEVTRLHSQIPAIEPVIISGLLSPNLDFTLPGAVEGPWYDWDAARSCDPRWTPRSLVKITSLSTGEELFDVVACHLGTMEIIQLDTAADGKPYIDRETNELARKRSFMALRVEYLTDKEAFK